MDFYVPTRDEVLKTVRSFLLDMGYLVSLNDPYKGLELVRRHGRPTEGQHSLQVEINRALFLDDVPVERTGGFATLQADLTERIKVLVEAQAATSVS